jgi:Recombination endonuclease VII
LDCNRGAGCGRTKSIEEFYKKRSGSDGFATYCGPYDIQKTGRSRRKRKYGMAAAEFDDLLLSQHGKCAICKRPSYTKKGLVVDHCHRTGAIRGILCSRCNSALGLFDDDPALLERALEYLR